MDIHDIKILLNKISYLMDDEIHVWPLCLNDYEKYIPNFEALLSKDELERARNFKFSRDQDRFIIGRGLLRCLLAGYLDLCPSNLEIVYGLWGKPRLAKEKLLNFNLSHSGDYALYAFTRHYEVGIDLEYIDRNLELEGVALSAFTSDELSFWEKLSLKDKADGFFKLWVCKEAFLKALGKGWLEKKQSMKLDSTISFDNRETLNFSPSELFYPYYFECIPGYASALFVSGPPLRIVHYN